MSYTGQAEDMTEIQHYEPDNYIAGWPPPFDADGNLWPVDDQPDEDA